MKLRLGQPVHATDGLFGELADIIVDPGAGTVTHIIIQPHRNHHQARLVPTWLVTEEPQGLTVQMDTQHLRCLERVAESDYVKIGERLDVGPDWDVGTEDVSIIPYDMTYLDAGLINDEMIVNYDRIPKGECEIRWRSEVVSSDGDPVGHVDGFLADDQHLTAIVVRVGLPGFRHDVLVPFESVGRVRNDQIKLKIDKAEFRRLPHTER